MSALATFRRAIRRQQRRARKAGLYAPQAWCRIVLRDPSEAADIDFAERARQCRASLGGTRAFIYERCADAVARLHDSQGATR